MSSIIRASKVIFTTRQRLSLSCKKCFGFEDESEVLFKHRQQTESVGDPRSRPKKKASQDETTFQTFFYIVLHILTVVAAVVNVAIHFLFEFDLFPVH